MEEEEEEEEEVEDGVRAFWTFPPNIRFPSLVQLEPPWLFFMVAAGGEEGNQVTLCTFAKRRIGNQYLFLVFLLFSIYFKQFIFNLHVSSTT